MDVVIQPVRSIAGKISLPGDKSISHRAVILGGIAKGRSRVENFLPSQDCLSTLNCLRFLGVDIKRVGHRSLEINGVGRRGLQEPRKVLDAGNSGTTMRLLAGVLSGQPFQSVISGDGSLRQRPMGRIVEPLQRMGALISGRDQNRFAPLTIQGGELKAIDYTTKVASAQVKSAILLAGLYAQGRTVVREPALSRDHTERMLQHMGKKLRIADCTVSIEGGGELQGGDTNVPGDVSSAAYFLVAATIVGNSRLVMGGIGVNPTRTGLIDVLRRMGANISMGNERMICNEPVADIEVTPGQLRGMEISGKTVPTLIDELPVLAVAATQAMGTTVVKDAAELRVKETDRISAMAAELSKMGARIEQREDGWVIEGPTPLRGARCRSHGDHRVAMAVAVSGFIAQGETRIQGAECIDISFPGFLKTIEKAARR
jgi:3-phosphoshikimate 1-carboxyvinyltransferase